MSRRLVSALVAATCLPLVLAGGTAIAAPSAGVHVSLSIAIPVRSLTITVQQPSVNAGCTVGLQAGSVFVGLSPSSSCGLPVGTITIKNGRVSGHISVNGSDAIPADDGKHWQLCGGSGRTCAGKRGRPGTDQFQVTALGGTKKPTSGTILTYARQCDAAFDLTRSTLGCVAAAGQTGTEGLNGLTPFTSTDKSKTFATEITWTATE